MDPTKTVTASRMAMTARTARTANIYHCMAAMEAKPNTDEGRQADRKCKWMAEPPKGWIKNVLGFRQFSLRGCTGWMRSGNWCVPR